VFDRIAVKRAVPEIAVIARLSKGVGGQLAKMLERFAKRVWLAFDNDTPGESATLKTIGRLKGIDVLEIRYPAKDPGELLERKGVTKMGEIIRRQMSLLRIENE